MSPRVVPRNRSPGRWPQASGRRGGQEGGLVHRPKPRGNLRAEPVPPPTVAGVDTSPRGWTRVAVTATLALPVWLGAAWAGWLWTPPFAGGPGHPGQGTALWAVSGLAVVGGVGVAPGPARGRRLVGSVVVGALWFVVGRFVLSAG